MESVELIYRIGKKIARGCFTEPVRIELRQKLESRPFFACIFLYKNKSNLQRVLAEKIAKHPRELLTFEQYSGCLFDNNAA